MDGLISVNEARAYAREHWPSPVVRRPLEALLDNCPRVEGTLMVLCNECENADKMIMASPEVVYCNEWQTCVTCDGYCYRGRRNDHAAD